MKLGAILVSLIALGGVAHAQEPPVSPRGTTTPRIFSPETLAEEVSKRQASGVSKQREPMLTTEKLSRPPVLAGLGLMAIGGIMAATAGESATFTTINPVTGQTISSTVTVTENGKRWTGVSLLGAGGVLTYLGLSK
jgi:hypothetical protein